MGKIPLERITDALTQLCFDVMIWKEFTEYSEYWKLLVNAAYLVLYIACLKLVVAVHINRQ